jgi:hypothetical protein
LEKINKMAKTESQYQDAMLGGSDGGKYYATGTTNAAVDFIDVSDGTLFTVLTDDLDANLLTGKNLTGITFVGARILNAGVGRKFKAISYSAGQVFGYKYGSSQL